MQSYNSFNELAAANMTPECVGSGMSLFNEIIDNMTQVMPKVVVSDKQLQDKLNKIFIGARGKEFEVPHTTIRTRDKREARLLLSTGELMEMSKVDKDIIEAVKADMKANPDKYIKNWNENNPDHAIPLKQEKQNELQTKDESWKEEAWYKEQQRLHASDEEGTWQG